MIHYYINPKTRDLIFFDSEEEEIIVVPRIEKVRVLIGNELQLGDFEPNLKTPAARLTAVFIRTAGIKPSESGRKDSPGNVRSVALKLHPEL